MAKAQTLEFSSDSLAQLALESFVALPFEVQDLLLRSKNEQTFSGQLAGALQSKMLSQKKIVLLELKGAKYIRNSKENKQARESLNSHDIAIINGEAKFEIITENKVWIHFDGAKGKKRARIEPGILRQIEKDIKKVNLTIDKKAQMARGFILFYVVTPTDPAELPKEYFDDFKLALSRCGDDLNRYRREGRGGIIQAFSKFANDLEPVVSREFTILSPSGDAGMLDIFCSEIKRR